MADEMRPGDGPLEARTPGIYHMAGGTNTDEVCSGETAGDGTPVIKEHSAVCAKGSAGVGTPETWRNGIPNMFEGAIMIGATGENASDEGGFIIDPGGGENISTSKAGKITAIINGMTQESTQVCAPGSIGAGTAEEWRGGIPRGLMIDPGGGDNIYTGGGEIFYPEIKDPGGGEIST